MACGSLQTSIGQPRTASPRLANGRPFSPAPRDDKSAQRYVDSIPNFFTPRGYAVVPQELRGRYRSEGFGEYFHTANVREGVDGFDTIEWIAAKPWSNGKLGMVG